MRQTRQATTFCIKLPRKRPWSFGIWSQLGFYGGLCLLKTPNAPKVRVFRVTDAISPAAFDTEGFAPTHAPFGIAASKKSSTSQKVAGCNIATTVSPHDSSRTPAHQSSRGYGCRSRFEETSRTVRWETRFSFLNAQDKSHQCEIKEFSAATGARS